VDLADVIEDLEWLIDIKMMHRLGMFWYVMVIMMRAFRGFAGQPRIATIGRTIGQAGSDILHLAIIVFVVFMNFVLGGCVLFGAELAAWNSFPTAMRSTIDMAFGGGNFEEMHAIMPLSAIAWLFLFVLSMIFILQNLFMAIIVDYHVEVQTAAAGAEGISMFTQLAGIFGDIWWTGSYVFRVVYRLVWPRLPPYIQPYFRRLHPEPTRVWKVPWEVLLSNLGAKGEVYDEVYDAKGELCTNAGDREIPSWEYADMDMLLRAQCDESTANRLFTKCRAFAAGRTPDTYPPEKLVAEFEGAMTRSYDNINSFNDELRGWLAEKNVDCANMEPRQKRLEHLCKVIQPIEADCYDSARGFSTQDRWAGLSSGNAMFKLENGAAAETMLPVADDGGDQGHESLAIWPDVKP